MADKKYAYSTNEENYTGEFNSIEEACEEGFWVPLEGDYEIGATIFAGEMVPPPPPEESFDRYAISDWLEKVAEQDEYSGEWAIGWGKSTNDQNDELVAEIRKVMAAWLDRHDLRPKFFNVDRIRKYQLTKVVDGMPVFEEL